MDSYSFFFDESYHDRKIRVKESGEINVLREDTLDNYIGVFWGCKSKEIDTYRKYLLQFEEKYRTLYKLSETQELKSTLISKKNFKYGIESFNKETLCFYKDLFSTLNVLNPIIQVNMISKMELYLRDVFSRVKFAYPMIMNENGFYYSLTKFFITYHTTGLLKALWAAKDIDNTKKFVDMLVNALETISIHVKDIPRKEQESKVFSELAFFLETAEYSDSIAAEKDFCYENSFKGLNLLLGELNILQNTVHIFIDNEHKTYEAAKTLGYASVQQSDSMESIEIRVSDWIAGFIGRIIHAMLWDENMLEDKVVSYDSLALCDLSRKRIISEEWFILSREQYELYSLVYEVMLVNQEHYWSAMTMSYGDQCALFYSLLRYFGTCNSYEDYNKMSPDQHREVFNSEVVLELQRHYQSFNN